MLNENDLRHIEGVILAIDRLILVKNEHSLEEAQNDFRVSDVLLMEFENLANSAMKLSYEFIDSNQFIPIDKMRAIRNRIAHDYLSVSLETLYETIDDDLLNLKKNLLDCIKNSRV